MSKATYQVMSFWEGDAQNPEVIASCVVSSLDQLKKIAGSNNGWSILDAPAWDALPLEEVQSKMAEFVASQVYRSYDDKVPDSRGGYKIIGLSEDADGGPTPDDLCLEVTAGSQWSNRLDFRIGSVETPPDPASVTYPVYRQAMDALASLWPVPWMWVRCMLWSDATSRSWTIPPAGSTREEWLASMTAAQPPKPVEAVWMLYLSSPLANRLKAPPELTCEPTPGGGVTLSAMLDRPDPGDPDHRRRMGKLAEIMAERVGRGDEIYKWGPRTGPY